MKKTIATFLAALMLAGVAIGGVAQTASAAPYSMHQSVVIHHSKHWREHLVCTVKWRHHHKVKLCVWVPDRHNH